MAKRMQLVNLTLMEKQSHVNVKVLLLILRGNSAKPLNRLIGNFDSKWKHVHQIANLLEGFDYLSTGKFTIAFRTCPAKSSAIGLTPLCDSIIINNRKLWSFNQT